MLIILGTCYLIPLFGGWLADAHLGRFNTIYGSSLLYVVGTILLAAVSVRNKTLATWFDDKSFAHDHTIRLVYFVISLVLISFGTGGIKANVSPFELGQLQILELTKFKKMGQEQSKHSLTGFTGL